MMRNLPNDWVNLSNPDRLVHLGCPCGYPTDP